MERPTVMQGEKVALGILMEQDIPALLNIFNDRNVTRYLRFPGLIQYPENEKEFLSRAASSREKELFFAIIGKEQNEFMGVVSLHEIDWRNSNAYVAFSIGKDYWGKGYTTEAVGLIVEYSFYFLNLRKLRSSVLRPNVASIRVLEKNGFSLCGTFERHSYAPGHGYVDELFFELFNAEHKF